MTRRRKRNPVLWVVMIALVVALGLGSRREAGHLPGFVVAYVGDTLWALVAFLGIGLVLPGVSTRWVAVLAMSFSTLIEVSQLYHAPWIDSIRDTTPALWSWAMASSGATWPATPWASESA